MIVVFATLFCVVSASDVGAIFGDGAISQVLRHAAFKAFEEPREIDLLLQSREAPGLPPLALFDVFQTVEYRNISVNFHQDAVHLIVDKLTLDSFTHVSDIFWPFGIGDKVVNLSIQLPKAEMRVNVDQSTLRLKECHLGDPSLATAVEDHWFADRSASVLASLLKPTLETVLCSVLTRYLENIQHSKITRLPVHDLVPEKAQRYLSAQNTTAFYKLRSIKLEEKQLTVLARIEWDQIADSPDRILINNVSALNIELRDRDTMTIWLEDSILNNLLAQIDWQFEWMNEQIPVSSEIIPPDSREFLSTLCTECYFQVNVAARGQPSVTATNNSLVLEKRDRVHLQVVNPNRNQTSVFVSFVLTIVAEVRPSFDDGVLRTLVQLIDTNITMESGAFPKNWGLFMQDLMRGMIMDMLWPEIKSAIEDLTYSKGLIISKTCGVDPNQLQIEIDEGTIALTSKMMLEDLDPEECLKEIKRSLPNTSKIFGRKHQP